MWAQVYAGVMCPCGHVCEVLLNLHLSAQASCCSRSPCGCTGCFCGSSVGGISKLSAGRQPGAPREGKWALEAARDAAEMEKHPVSSGPSLI